MVSKGYQEGGNTGEIREEKGRTREIASDLTQEQLTFPSWPGNNYVHTL